MKFFLALFFLLPLSSYAQWQNSEDYSASLFGGFSVMNSEVGGTGLQSSSKNNAGMGFGTLLRGKINDDNTNAILKYQQNNAVFKVPSSTSNVDVSRQLATAGVSFSAIEEKLDVGIGYSMVNYDATSNHYAITNLRTHGLRAFSSAYFEISSDWMLNFHGDLYLPFSVQEKSGMESGYNSSFIGADLAVHAQVVLYDSWFAWGGVSYFYDSINFTGLGQRGTSSSQTRDARDTRTGLFFPIGLGRGF